MEYGDFQRVSDGIYKLNFPYADGFTGVLALEADGRWLLMDFGAKDADGRDYILPAIRRLGFVPECLVCSHTHEDHVGGVRCIADAFPNAKLLFLSPDYRLDGREIERASEGMLLLGRYRVVALRGHASDELGLFDTRTRVLVCGDALQLYGIGGYGLNLDDPRAYAETLDRLAADPPDGLICSHEYEPYGSTAFGAAAVGRYLDTCKDGLFRTVKAIRDCESDDYAAIGAIFRAQNPGHPPLCDWTLKEMIPYVRKMDAAAAN